MSRFELRGKGDPIPNIALPDPNLDSDFPPQVFVLEHGVPFEKVDWVGLGYTHYEVWCVGGAGGRGGKVAPIMWDMVWNRGTIPNNVWNGLKELAARNQGPTFVEGRWVPYGQWNPQQWEPLNPARWMEVGERMEYTNPTHQGANITYIRSKLGEADDSQGVGGAGGGGGVHKVGGLLADLPASVPVTVGKVGSDTAPLGHMLSGAPVLSEPFGWGNRSNSIHVASAYEYIGMGVWYTDARGMELVQLINAWFSRWPTPHNSLNPAQAGLSGGASSFGDICRASGGKGGGAALTWPGGVKTKSSYGGEGGLGDRLTAGGGGAGSTSFNEFGDDGGWDGQIGGGGGGGRGGSFTPAVFVGHPTPAKTVVGTGGGRGAWSFADTTVYGTRQLSSGPIPGGGGGVKVNRTIPAGSHAVTFSPNGLVAIRLTKVEV